jgi:DNA-binding IclR family transcriptional regulator
MATQEPPNGAAARNGNGVGIQIISRAVDLLRALGGEAQGLSLSQLAERTDLPRSTVHRLVAALEVEGLLVAASPNGRVRIGPDLIRLADASRPDLHTQLRPVMQTLFDTLDETVDLAVLDGDHLRFIDQIPAPHRLRAVSTVGATFPLHCTANGKAVLAQLTDDEIRELLPAKLSRYTPATITSRAALLEELALVRQTGVACDREEHTSGISAGGVAVRDPMGTFAALSVPMPTMRFEGQEKIIGAALAEAHEELATIFDVD